MINDPGLAEKMLPTLRRVIGDDKVKMMDPVMGGEDFAYFANEVPGFYYRLGVVKPGTVSGWVHTPTFRADDSCLETGIGLCPTSWSISWNRVGCRLTDPALRRIQ